MEKNFILFCTIELWLIPDKLLGFLEQEWYMFVCSYFSLNWIQILIVHILIP